MVTNRKEFSVHCDWCKIEVISFAQPPALVDVATNAWEKRVDRICLDCYGGLLALIGSRAAARAEHV